MIQTLRLGKMNMKSLCLNLSLTLTSSFPTEQDLFFVLCVCLRASGDIVGAIGEVLGIQMNTNEGTL